MLSWRSIKGRLLGTTTNDNAVAGAVGEYIASVVGIGSAVSLTTLTAADITTISLTPGDWDVYGQVTFLPAGSTTIASVTGSINTTSATLATVPESNTQIGGSLTTGVTQNIPCTPTRISVSVTTSVYLVARAGFGVSTMTACGKLWARRAR